MNRTGHALLSPINFSVTGGVANNIVPPEQNILPSGLGRKDGFSATMEVGNGHHPARLTREGGYGEEGFLLLSASSVEAKGQAQ